MDWVVELVVILDRGGWGEAKLTTDREIASPRRP